MSSPASSPASSPVSGTATATLEDGSRVEYFTDVLGQGGMKTVHLSVDRKQVVCFFTEKPDATREARLGFVLHRFNPTTGGGDAAEYFKRLFCWPTGIVKQPRLGIVCPTYPGNFFFASGRFKGKEKKANWFVRPKVRRMVEPAELGPWINYVRLSLLLARAIRRMHLAGLAHSDLSCNNVLIDPLTGQSIVIDIDSLVVANLHPADVAGTPKYIAPEVVATQDKPLGDPAKRLPSIYTDLHSLPVLLYEYLLHRHPLIGPKNHSPSTEEDESLAMGARALFIEHPTDHSNQPDDLTYPYTVLGPHLSKLFERAFVDGLHDPQRRPSAADWERGLAATWDLLHPCRNPACTHKWFVFDPARPACGFCGTKVAGPVPLLKLRRPGMKPGQWVADGAVVGFDTPAAKQCLYPWHAMADRRNDERTRPEQKTPVADFAFYRGAWVLMNRDLPTMTSAKGNAVPVGQAAGLANGSVVTLSTGPQGRMAEVEIVQP